MARSLATIYQQLLAQKNAQPNLSTLNSTSQVSIWNLWLWIYAAGQSIFEQLCDLFKTNVETIVSNAPVFSPQWYQNMLLYFQYSATNPQVVAALPDYSIGYTVKNTSLNIITRASVITTTSRAVNIKVATGYPLGPLDGQSVPYNTPGPQYNALLQYLSAIGVPGTQFNVISLNPDYITCNADIYIDASYNGVILGNLQAAYDNFLDAIPFDGTFLVSDLIAALLGVEGVNDVVINYLYAQAATDGYTGKNYLVNTLTPNESTLILRYWQTIAGYAIDNPSSTFSSNINIKTN